MNPRVEVPWGQEELPSHSDHHVMEVKNLRVAYADTVALNSIAFRAACGTSVALIGPNGAGKSTLIKSLARLLKPQTGTIFWNGRVLSSHTREIAYLPQRGEVDWNFPLTVRGLVEMGRYGHLGWWRPFRKTDAEMVDRALEAMKITDLQKRQISALSGGQQQRAFLARALAQEPHVLLLDEPFTGLDLPSQQLLAVLLRELVAEGRLLVASHHDLGNAEAIYDNVLLLNRRMIAFGPAREVLTPGRLAEAYQAPETRAILLPEKTALP